jgi:hypothetical protein
MKKVYESHYANRYRSMPDVPGPAAITYVSLRKMIDSADSQFAQKRLRPDAKLFLLINFGEMVAAPLARAKVPQTKEMNDIRHGIEAVVKLAADVTPARDKISSHQIVSVVPIIWGKLKSLTDKLWH